MPNVQCRIDYLPLPEGVCFILALLSSVIGNDPNVQCRIDYLPLRGDNLYDIVHSDHCQLQTTARPI
jgi:hypothetical protein